MHVIYFIASKINLLISIKRDIFSFELKQNECL